MNALDSVLPDYAHHEVHRTSIDAVPERVWRAVHEVTAGELPMSGVLMAIRSLPARLSRRGALSGRHRGGPVLAQALRSGFCTLVTEPPHAYVAGAIGRPWRLGSELLRCDGPDEFAAFATPGYVKMAIDFVLEPAPGGGTLLTTETRIQPTDPASARSFRRYWTIIRLGSGLIRRDYLRAIRRRATRPAVNPARA
jgi:hypothetical protein